MMGTNRQDSTRIVSGSSDKTPLTQDAKSGLPIGAPLQGHERSMYSVAFSPDGARVVSSSGLHIAVVIDARAALNISSDSSGSSTV
jgi:WD40 repeat protein